MRGCGGERPSPAHGGDGHPLGLVIGELPQWEQGALSVLELVTGVIVVLEVWSVWVGRDGEVDVGGMLGRGGGGREERIRERMGYDNGNDRVRRKM